MSSGGPGTFLRTTVAYCPVCRESELAIMTAREGGVFMERMCPGGPAEPERVAASREWYDERTAEPQEAAVEEGRRPIGRGCPHDCGPCQAHTGGLRLPVFSITNDCNLACPKCFTYNRPDQKYYKTPEDTRKIVDHILKRAGKVQLINLTGGEPTMHPRLAEIIAECQRPEIGRITMNTNGIRLSGDRELARMLKEAGVQVVLSLDSLNPETSARMNGRDVTREKRGALAMLEEMEIPATLLMVCAKGVNETDVAEMCRDFIGKDFVRSITIQNMTFTGFYGSKFKPRRHITLDEVEVLLEGTGAFSRGDFFSHASYHPLCYSIAYYLVSSGKAIPLARILGKDALREMTKGRYYMEAGTGSADIMREGINRIWAESGDDRLVRELRGIMEKMFPRGGAPAGGAAAGDVDRYFKAVCLHSHMDEDNFDLDRVSRCGDLVPDEDGRMVPACSYNLFYRQSDPRFWVESAGKVGESNG